MMIICKICYRVKKNKVNNNTESGQSIAMEPGGKHKLVAIDSASYEQEQSNQNNTNENERGNAVKIWLTDTAQLPEYYDLFVQNGFDTMDAITCISDRNVLQDIGINKIGHQMKLINDINKLSQHNSNPSTPKSVPKDNTVVTGEGEQDS